jgi:hypothetical protein
LRACVFIGSAKAFVGGNAGDAEIRRLCLRDANGYSAAPILKTSDSIAGIFAYSSFKGELKCQTHLDARQEGFRYLKNFRVFASGFENRNGAGTEERCSPEKCWESAWSWPSWPWSPPFSSATSSPPIPI